MPRILVAYATRSGTAEEVARTVGAVLIERGAKVTVRPVREVEDIRGYNAIVLGSSVRVGRLMPEMLQFAEAHRETLAAKPVACFIVCLTMQEDTEEARREASAFLEPLRAIVRPVSEGLFAGAVRPDRLGLGARLAMRLTRAPRGDFRDWEAIRAWAAGLIRQF